MSDESQSGKAREGRDDQPGPADADEGEVKEEMKQVEEDPPDKLEDWPSGKAKYETFGGPEGRHSYDEGPERKLGPASLRHEEGGEVTIEGEKVDNPEEFKSDPIPGGPTDPNSPDVGGEKKEPDRSPKGPDKEG